MRCKLLGTLLLFLSVSAFGAEWENKIWVSSLTFLENGLPAAKGAENNFTNTSNYLFLSSSAMLTQSLGAEGIFSAGLRYFSTDFESVSETNFSVNQLAAVFKYGGVSLKAGRIFYGSQNTLLPYYGLYDDYYGAISSALDGAYAAAELGKYFNINAVYGKETESNFSEGDRTLAGAVLSFRPAAGVSLSPFIFDYRRDDKYLMYKRELVLYGGYFDWNIDGRSDLYISYAANGGQDTYYGNMVYGSNESYGGSALLVKFNTENEKRGVYYKLHFLYLNCSGTDIGKVSFKSVHPYIYLGSIFTGANLIQRAGVAGAFSRYYAGSADNIRAYNMGASLSPAFAKFVKINFDVYSYSTADFTLKNRDIGGEIDAGLAVTPFKNLDLSAVYARFYPGQGFKDRYDPRYFDVGNVTQFSFKASLKF
ncbi:MAG: hypothetical protein LBI01_02210 [Elusimicrobium sp.]|jgi:hypothetical protein|nr:hypothetical protein [Elusimicrobium sp.]